MIEYQVGQELFCASIHNSRRTQILTVDSVGAKYIHFKGRPRYCHVKAGGNILYEGNDAIGRLYQTEAEYNSIQSDLAKRNELQKRFKSLMGTGAVSNEKLEAMIEILEATDE